MATLRRTTQPKTSKVARRYNQSAIYGWQSSNKSALDILNEYQKKIQNGDWLSTEDRAKYKSAIDSYTSSGNALREASRFYGTKYTADEEKSWNDSLSSLQSGYSSVNDFYNQFASDKVYGDWKTREDSRVAYENSLKNVDINKANEGWQAYLADVEAENTKDEKWWETLGRWLGGSGGVVDTTLPMAGTTQTIHNLRDDVSHQRPKDDWTQEQKNAFGELYATSPYLAYQFAEETNNRNNAAKEENQILALEAWANKNGWNQALASVVAVGGSFFGLADALGDLALSNAGREYSGSGDGQISPFEASQAITGSIAENLNQHGTLPEDWWGIGGKGWGDLYALGMSRAQSVASGALLGGAGTLVNYFGQGMASGFDEAKARGATDGQAATLGVLSGAFEGLSEMIGVDRLFKIKDSKTLGGLLLNVLKQAGAEGIEEGITTTLNLAADNFIMRDRSQFAYDVAAYMNAGFSEKEAKSKAWGKATGDIFADTLGGAISGGMGGGVSTIGQTIKENANAKKTYSGQDMQLTDDAVNSLDPEVAAVGNKMQQKLDKGKNLSGWNLNQLIDVTDTSKIRTAAEARLTELGETGDVSAIADVIARQTAGEELSFKDRAVLNKSTKANIVLTEMMPENVKGGGLANKWAEGIGTKRVNADVYNKGISESQRLVAKAAQEMTSRVKGFTDEAASAMVKGYDGTQNPSEYIKNFKNSFEIGRDRGELSGETNSAMKVAYVIGQTEAERVANLSESEASREHLAEFSKKYGDQAQAAIDAYEDGQDVVEYESGYDRAFEKARSGLDFSYIESSEDTAYLTEAQKKAAYEAGIKYADSVARQQAENITTQTAENTVRRKGAVKGEGVKISDLRKAFNDTQNRAYKVLSRIAEATGIDIVLYKSEVDAKGNYRGAQGKFKWSNDKIYIDLNAGLNNVKDTGSLANYTMLRTFSHEFSHFIEKHDPMMYNELRRTVFSELTARGSNVEALIAARQGDMDIDNASREVVAEALTDILPDSHFVEILAQKNPSALKKISTKLKEFVSNVKSYFASIKPNSAIEAKALKEERDGVVRYVQSIIDAFDKAAVSAVENYQRTKANSNSTTSNDKIQEQSRDNLSDDIASDIEAKEKKMQEIMSRFGLTEKEAWAVLKYKSAEAYKINAKLRENDMLLNAMQKEMVKLLDSALGKLPKHKGKAYRTVSFDDLSNSEAEYNAFLKEHTEGSFVDYPAYTSTSAKSDGHPMPQNTKYGITLEIECESGRNLDGFGNNFESEVLYPRDFSFVVTEVGTDKDGRPYIKLKDIGKNVRHSRNTEERSNVLQQVQAESSLHGDLQEVSGQDTARSGKTEKSVQGVRSEGRTEVNVDGTVEQYQEREEYSLDNRSLLVNALESATQNEIEAKKLSEYRANIKDLNEQSEKLMELKKEIKELSFKKGPRDTARLRELRDEVIKTENRINLYDKRLLNLEATKALRDVITRETQKAYKKAEQKGKEALKVQRKRAEAKLSETRKQYQESRARATEGRHKTEIRHKIQGVVKDLDSYLRTNSKDKHVPIELQRPVAAALDAINMDTVDAEARIAKKQAEMMQAKTPEAVEKIAREIEYIRKMGDNFSDKISKLKEAYAAILDSDDPLIANSHDDIIESTIDKVLEVVGDTPLKNMSMYQLEAVYDMYKMVLTSVRNANRAFTSRKSEAISDIAERAATEIRAQGHKTEFTNTGKELSRFAWNNSKSVYAFERIGSKTLSGLHDGIRDGEDVLAVDMDEAAAFREATQKKYNYTAWDTDKKYSFKSSNGLDFELDVGQIMSLYAFAKRGEQAKGHFRIGGFVFDTNVLKKKRTKLGLKYTVELNDASNYTISDKLLMEITSKLTAEQKAFADEMQAYLSDVMGEKGNEVSLELYGIKLFKEKNYFPLRTAKQYLERAREQNNQTAKIKNKGFTKETKPGAGTQVVLSSFMDVWAEHVYDMSMYHAFTLPMEDFYRVYNYKGTGEQSPVIDLTDDNELSKTVEGVYGARRYKLIADYIMSILGNQQITLSDGRGAIIDKRDSLHIANKSGSDKTRQISKIKELISQSTLYARDSEAEHNKFNEFLYYKAVVRYGAEEFPLYLNVGKGINDSKYHIYDITKKIRDTAGRINGLERPKPNEGYALENGISNNRISQNDEFVNTQNSNAIIPLIQNAFGVGATQYIDQFLKDVNGGAIQDSRESFGAKALSRFKKAKTFLSLSVWVQQPTSIVRAQAFVSPKYFIKKKMTKEGHKKQWAEIKKYAPVAIIKEMGRFDVGMGKGAVDWLKGDKTFMDKVDDVVSFVPSYLDEATWISIWNAVKLETAGKNPSLNTSSEEFLKKAGKRFTEVVTKTQVYNSTLSRSGNMRSKSLFMQMATAFMAEPTTSINMLESAWRSGDKMRIVKTMGAVYGSVLLNSAVVALVFAGRDDDEDETFLEKYLSSFTTEVLDGMNPLTYLPYVKDIWSTMQGFSVERTDMSIMGDVANSLKRITQAIAKYDPDMSESESEEFQASFLDAIESVVGDIANLFGIPVKNVKRDIDGIINSFNTIKKDIEGRETTKGSLEDELQESVQDVTPIWGWLPGESKGKKLYDAIMAGDERYVARFKNEYVEKYSDIVDAKEREKKITSAYESALRAALRDNDPRLEEAALARLEGDTATYDELEAEVIAEGNFDKKLIKAAFEAEFNYHNTKKKEAEERGQEYP